MPFHADGPTAMLFQYAYGTPPPLHEAAPEVPEAVARVVERMMAKDPAQRYQSCEEVLADLRHARAVESRLTASAGAWGPPSQPPGVARLMPEADDEAPAPAPERGFTTGV